MYTTKTVTLDLYLEIFSNDLTSIRKLYTIRETVDQNKLLKITPS